MQFNLGKPILVMMCVSVVTGALILLRPERGRGDVLLWSFTSNTMRVHQKNFPTFENRTGCTVQGDVIGGRPLNIRLGSLYLTGRSGAEVPDVVELEIGSIGQYFRPPIDDIGLLPLNRFLQTRGQREIHSLSDPGHKGWNARLLPDGGIYTHDGHAWRQNPARTSPDTWKDRVLPARFGPWSKQGVIFGIPYDLHPTVITFREDLFREAGIDLAACATWSDFHEKCLQFENYWKRRGHPFRHAFELSDSTSYQLLPLLLQRGINLVDDAGRLHFTDPKVLDTLLFYTRLVAGPRQISGVSAGGFGSFARDVEEGNLCAFLTPDWRTDYFRMYVPSVAGKMRAMPLPRFDPQDSPTTTVGGTMMGISRACPNPQRAWELVEDLYLNPQALRTRLGTTSIIPPLIEAWDWPEFHQPDPYYAGQKINQLLIELAPQVPTRIVTPVTSVAEMQMTTILNRAVAHVQSRGSEGLEEACRLWLAQAEQDVQRRINHLELQP